MANKNGFGIITDERDVERRTGQDRRQGAPWSFEDEQTFGERRTGFERRAFERRIDSEDDDPL